ncbi:methyltransferase [Ideonella sp. A 288]|uniref:class I SAM-dependent methyltransferase n=1 Tax=Ideonella sp. A 288 TaxID=1962181 RepID=UPI000B4A896C|nr:methyltransferase domain-containing protein [Ideonella sp. A 288]
MPGYDTKQECIAVDGTADLQIRSLLDRQQFADVAGEAAALGISSATWPLFGLLWPSGRALAAHMALRTLRPGDRILEIGCGLALASLVCHRRGADVTASDCHPLAEAFLRENLRLNAMLPLHYRHGPWDGEPSPSGFALRDPVVGRFDLIIGSDVLYERDDGGHLPRFIERHAQPGACVLIVDPDRSNRSAFNRRMLAMGFTLRESRLDRRAREGDAGYKGRLLCFERPRQAAAPDSAWPA